MGSGPCLHVCSPRETGPCFCSWTRPSETPGAARDGRPGERPVQMAPAPEPLRPSAPGEEGGHVSPVRAAGRALRHSPAGTPEEKSQNSSGPTPKMADGASSAAWAGQPGNCLLCPGLPEILLFHTGSQWQARCPLRPLKPRGEDLLRLAQNPSGPAQARSSLRREEDTARLLGHFT